MIPTQSTILYATLDFTKLDSPESISLGGNFLPFAQLTRPAPKGQSNVPTFLTAASAEQEVGDFAIVGAAAAAHVGAGGGHGAGRRGSSRRRRARRHHRRLLALPPLGSPVLEPHLKRNGYMNSNVFIPKC